MEIPPPGMIRNSGTSYGQALDQPVYGSLKFCAPNIELPDHMQEVVSQNPHLQPGLIGLETLATGLVPAQGVLSLLNPVFHIPPPVIDLDYLAGWQSGVGHHSGRSGEGRWRLMPSTGGS